MSEEEDEGWVEVMEEEVMGLEEEDEEGEVMEVEKMVVVVVMELEEEEEEVKLRGWKEGRVGGGVEVGGGDGGVGRIKDLGSFGRRELMDGLEEGIGEEDLGDKRGCERGGGRRRRKRSRKRGVGREERLERLWKRRRSA